LNHGDGPFFARLQYTRENLLPVKPFAPAVLLDDHVWNLINSLVACEPSLAAKALAPSSDGLAFLAFPGIDNLVFKMTAKWTFHSFIWLLRSRADR
jgi:hypothetical protein